jgi:hypothetical protein
MDSSSATKGMRLRVSVAILNRVLFPHPQDGTLMLALERRATVVSEDGHDIRVRSQPFGGAVRILDPIPLQELIGEIHFDSEQSRRAGDFRILIRPSDWELVKGFCLQRLEKPDKAVLESFPHRELVEEFNETLKLGLKLDQFSVQPRGFVLENDPRPTDHIYAPGWQTVRVYRIYEVSILDGDLCRIMVAASQRYSDQELMALALRDIQNGGRGCANTILALPLDTVMESYLSILPEARFKTANIEGHQLDESVLAVLEDVNVSQYQRF